MRYLVVLNKDSVAGSLYAKGSNDGFVDGVHPVLICSEIVTDNPYYIFAIRPLDKEGKLRQSLFLPHGSVALIYQYDKDDEKPFGFSGKDKNQGKIKGSASLISVSFTLGY